MSEPSLTLSPPAVMHLKFRHGETDHTARIDVYEARRVLEEADRKPNEALRIDHILSWLAVELQIGREALAENMALEFNDCIAGIVARLNEDRKKKAASTACWPDSTPASQPASETGP